MERETMSRHQKQEAKNIIDVVCLILLVRARARLNYVVLVFIGAFDMMPGNSCSFDFYCLHASDASIQAMRTRRCDFVATEHTTSGVR